MIISIHCNSQVFTTTYINELNHHKMEKLNINELRSIKEKMRSEHLERKKIAEEDKDIKIVVTDDGSIHYGVKYRNGTFISISGNENGGFIKTETKSNSPIEKHQEFYKNGNLKKTGERYNEIVGVDPAGFSRNIGIWYTYDEEGKVIEKKEYDEKSFHFTLDDVKKYIEKEKLYVLYILKIPAVIINGKLQSKGYWSISTSTGNNSIRRINLDAETGKKLSESTRAIEK